jgi:hypothetical protein
MPRKYTKTGKHSKYITDEYGEKELTITERLKILQKSREPQLKKVGEL